MSVSIKDLTPVVRTKIERNSSLFIRLMLDEAHRQARPVTPKQRGNLSNDVLKVVMGLKGKIVWSKEYAAYQERGRRADGSHVVRNYTTGGTGKGFAQKGIRRAVQVSQAIARKANLS